MGTCCQGSLSGASGILESWESDTQDKIQVQPPLLCCRSLVLKMLHKWRADQVRCFAGGTLNSLVSVATTSLICCASVCDHSVSARKQVARGFSFPAATATTRTPPPSSPTSTICLLCFRKAAATAAAPTSGSSRVCVMSGPSPCRYKYNLNCHH